MKIGIDLVKSLKEQQWHDLEDGGSVRIRPYPASKEVFLVNQSGDLKLSGVNQKDKFIYCLTGWRDIVDNNGTPVDFSEKIKSQIFEWHTYDDGMFAIVNKVLEIVAKLKQTAEDDEGN